jgi:hypothetical protein
LNRATREEQWTTQPMSRFVVETQATLKR